MTKKQFEELQARNAHIKDVLLESYKDKCDQSIKSIITYINDNGAALTDNIVTLGKGDINITLHNSSFNNVLHYHDFIEIIYVYKGELTNNIYNEIINLKENECIIQYPSIHHKIIKADDTKSIILNIVINKSFFDTSYYKVLFESRSFFADKKNAKEKYIVCKNLKPIVKKLIDILLELFLNKEEYSELSFQNVLVLLLMEMLKRNENTNDDDFSSRLNLYINQNIKTISLQSTASHFGYHPKYFSCLIKNMTGKSFKDIVIEKKIEKAAYYLIYSDYSNSEISELIGYENNLSFYTNFKKIFNCSPNDYRKRMKEIN